MAPSASSTLPKPQRCWRVYAVTNLAARQIKNNNQGKGVRGAAERIARGSSEGTGPRDLLISRGSIGCLQATQTRTLGASICPQAGHGNGSSGDSGPEAVASPGSPLTGPAGFVGSTMEGFRRPIHQRFTGPDLQLSRSNLRGPSSPAPASGLPRAGADRTSATFLRPGCRPAIGRTTGLPAPEPWLRRRRS